MQVWDFNAVVNEMRNNSYEGFVGVSCHLCKRLANVPRSELVWICLCESVNNVHGTNAPHGFPSIGPTVGQLEQVYVHCYQDHPRDKRYRPRES